MIFEIVITVLVTLILISHLYLLFTAKTSKTIHQSSYNAAVGMANYLNEVGSAANAAGIEQTNAEIAKTMAEAKLLDAQADMIIGEKKGIIGLGE